MSKIVALLWAIGAIVCIISSMIGRDINLFNMGLLSYIIAILEYKLND